jgi:hypothetical protein
MIWGFTDPGEAEEYAGSSGCIFTLAELEAMNAADNYRTRPPENEADAA